MNRVCALTCERPHYAKGYCRMHYTRLKRNGTLNPQPARKAVPTRLPLAVLRDQLADGPSYEWRREYLTEFAS